jgi:hypothetical protein
MAAQQFLMVSFTLLQAMFAAQLIGMFTGCFLAPATFQMFVAGQPNLGEPGSVYPAPFAQVYRNMAVVGVGGASELGKHCLWVRARSERSHVDDAALSWLYGWCQCTLYHGCCGFWRSN